MRIGFKVFNTISVGLLVLRVRVGVCGLIRVGHGSSLIIEWEVLRLSSSLVSIRIVFDWISLFFLRCVCLISGIVIKYCHYYIHGEANFLRFSLILAMFVVSIWLLIICPNIVRLLLGWDGLGLTSYALVIYYQNEVSCNAGILTILRNRIGDVAILLRVAFMVSEGRWDFYNLTTEIDEWVVCLVILAGFTKRAQMPFSAWLPAAIAAPTPVRALVHSSTLVTAGVYLLIRFNEVIQKRELREVLLRVSALTMFMAGLGAVFERDIKKVVALSTLSQLGLMIIILRTGIKELAFFHLITHAIFKSSLFICVGFMIHRSGGGQDGRQIRRFGLSSPRLGIMLGLTNLALCGFPFLAGFYSKDAVLEYSNIVCTNVRFVWLIIGGTGLTVAYRFRVLYLRVARVNVIRRVIGLRDFDLTVLKSVGTLFLARLFSGFLMFWVVVPVGPPSYLRGGQKYSIGLVRLVGGVSAYRIIQLKIARGRGWVKTLEVGASCIWFIRQLRTKAVVRSPMFVGLARAKLADIGWFEYYGGQGGQSLMVGVSRVLQQAQGGVVVKRFIVTVFLRFLVLLAIA